MKITKAWCTGDKVGDVLIFGQNHSYSKWRIFEVITHPDGFRECVLVPVPWKGN